MNRYKLYIGDPSDDGHGKTDVFLLETNRTKKEIREIYKKSAELTGVEFENLFEEYEESSLSKDVITKFIECGIDFSKVTTYNTVDELLEEPEDCPFFSDDAVRLFIEYLKLSDSELIMNIADDEIDDIGIHFGYGLFE